MFKSQVLKKKTNVSFGFKFQPTSNLSSFVYSQKDLIIRVSWIMILQYIIIIMRARFPLAVKYVSWYQRLFKIIISMTGIKTSLSLD